MMSYWRVVICLFSRFVKLSTKQAQTQGHHFCCDRDIISLAANPGMNLDADTWTIGFTSFFFFFSELRPCGGRCLSMPFVSCYANHRTMYERLGDWDPVTFCQDGWFFGTFCRWMRANAAWCQCATLAVRHVSSNGCSTDANRCPF